MNFSKDIVIIVTSFSAVFCRALLYFQHLSTSEVFKVALYKFSHYYYYYYCELQEKNEQTRLAMRLE